MGIDRLSLSFPIEGFDDDPRSWRQRTDRAPRKEGEPWTSSYSGSVEVDGVPVFVGVQSMPSAGVRTVSFWGKVEFNPSRVVDPEGYSVAGVGGALEAAQAAWGAAGALLTPDCDLGDSRVKRLDVTRDFDGLPRPEVTIRALAPLHRPWARRNLVHADPVRHGAQTLMVGSGAGVVRLYDKHAETEGKAPPGTVRWEAECRPGWAQEYGHIKALSHITDATVSGLAQNRWEWSAMGAEVTSTSKVVDMVRVSGLTPREQATFIGWLMIQAHGGAYEPGSKALAKWRKVQRDLGLALEHLEEQSGGFKSRLDWDSGKEITRVA